MLAEHRVYEWIKEYITANPNNTLAQAHDEFKSVPGRECNGRVFKEKFELRKKMLR
jgi:hypothetical protein